MKTLPIFLGILFLTFLACKKETTQLASIPISSKSQVFLKNMNVFSIAIDSLDNVWCSNNILNKIEGLNISIFLFNNDSIGIIRSVVVDKLGRAWAGNDNYLAYYFNNKWTVFKQFNHNLNIFKSPNKGIYIIENDSLIEFDGVSKRNCIEVNQFFSSDKNGNIWLLDSIQGVLKYDGISITKTNIFPYKCKMLSCFQFDKNGNFWQASVDGLSKFDGKNWIHYNISNSAIPSNGVTCMDIDNFNNIWVGTISGISKFDGIKWTLYNFMADNVLSQYTETIVVDSKNNVWCGGSFGLIKINKN